MEAHAVSTPHGTIAVYTAGQPPSSSTPTLLLIHGNSSDHRIFRPICTSPAFTGHLHILAVDLPGHGASSDAPNPEETYTQAGYAAAILQVLGKLEIANVVILGWSLGGHVAIEMVGLLKAAAAAAAGREAGAGAGEVASTSTSLSTPSSQDRATSLNSPLPPFSPPPVTILGVMLTGTPPALGVEQTRQGFKRDSPHMHLAGQEVLSSDESSAFARETCGAPFEDWMSHAVTRTDGRARRLMFEAFGGGRGVDQVAVVRDVKEVIWAVVNGAEEPFVNLDYLDRLEWGNLWEGRCLRLERGLHAPFWEMPDVFGPILERFVKDCRKKLET